MAYLFVSSTIMSIIVEVKNRKKISLVARGMSTRGPDWTVHGFTLMGVTVVDQSTSLALCGLEYVLSQELS